VPAVEITARAGHPSFLDLPWDVPLADWRTDRLVDLARGISRHVVRFVDYDGRVYALKEMQREVALREYGLLRRLAEQDLPVVEAVGVASAREGADGEELEAVLITRHLDFSLPYRYLFMGRGVTDLRERLIDALALLLVRLHLEGFFWGDCSLSNALFRRDAGALTAYLVDAETGELRPSLTDGQRHHDLALAVEKVAGELLDLAAGSRLPTDVDPVDTAKALEDVYDRLWTELTSEEVIDRDEPWRVGRRLERLHELGFDVEELEYRTTEGDRRLHVRPRVVELGHHARELQRLTGLRVQENQARRLLNDVAAYRAELPPDTPHPVAAVRWLLEVFEPTVAAIPDELRGKLPPAELYHELLEHRWFLSEAAGADVGTAAALRSYVRDVLRFAPDERSLLPDDVADDV